MKAESESDALDDVEATQLTLRLQNALAKHPEVLEAYLFGSRANGNEHAASDVDVAVYVDRARTRAGTFGYQAELTAELMSSLQTNAIDLVLLNDAPPVLYHRVLRDGIRFMSRNLRDTTTREGQALSRYCDFLPQLAKIEYALQSGSRKPPKT